MPPTPTPKIRLTIDITENGQVFVSGPIDDLAFCYGLLEVARDELRAHHDKKRQSKIVPATAIDPFLQRKRE